MQPPHQDPTGRMESARASALRARAKITSQLARALRFLSSRRFPWLALAGSLVVHAVALMLVIKTSFQERTIEPSDRVITMHLAPRSPREPEPDLEPDPEIEMPVTDPQPPVRQQQPAGANTAAMDAPLDTLDTQEADTAKSGARTAPAQDPARLRARILEQVGTLPASQGDKKGSTPWPATGEAAPGLPGVRGWISTHVGRVRPGADTWKANDGSTRGRYVTADGTVVCTQRRAPTMDELMNSWKSTVVTMARICGRARPDAPDFTDPRVQPPPKYSRRSKPGPDD